MYLTVDSGVNEMGFALWPERGWGGSKVRLPEKAFCLAMADKYAEWWRRVDSVVNQLDNFLSGYQLQGVWCEMPVLFSGAGGHAAARRGDLTHLAYAVGAVGRFAYSRGASFKPVEVQEWIGQLPKPVMRRRVRNLLERDNNVIDVARLLGKESHHWDAIGVGLYAQGHWA